MAPERTILDGATVVTMDGARTEHATGHVVVENGRIAAVGDGLAPADLGGPRTDVTGCLITPGFVNTHHHLYQWITRGLAVDDTLFGWLTTLYPVWGGIDADIVGAAAAAGLAWLAGTGCTTSTDHHYVFPRRRGRARRRDRRGAPGGPAVPPDPRVDGPRPEQGRAAAGQRGRGHRHHPGRQCSAIDTYHDPWSGLDAADRGGALLAVLGDRGPAAADRRAGPPQGRAAAHPPVRDPGRGGVLPGAFRLHPGASTWSRWAGWAPTCGWPTAPLRRLGHPTLAATGTCVAHCPTSNARLGSGIARAGDLRDAGVAVGLGVDGAASQRGLLAAGGGPARPAVRPGQGRPAGADRAGRAGDGHDGRRPGARPGRRDRLAGGRASWPTSRCGGWTRLAHIDIVDPVAALVLGAPPPLELLLVGGEPVVERDRLITVDEHELTCGTPAGCSRADRYWPARVTVTPQGTGTGVMTEPHVIVNGRARARRGRRARHPARMAARPGSPAARRAARRASAAPAR